MKYMGFVPKTERMKIFLIRGSTVQALFELVLNITLELL